MLPKFLPYFQFGWLFKSNDPWYAALFIRSFFSVFITATARVRVWPSRRSSSSCSTWGRRPLRARGRRWTCRARPAPTASAAAPPSRHRRRRRHRCAAACRPATAPTAAWPRPPASPAPRAKLPPTPPPGTAGQRFVCVPFSLISSAFNGHSSLKTPHRLADCVPTLSNFDRVLECHCELK